METLEDRTVPSSLVSVNTYTNVAEGGSSGDFYITRTGNSSDLSQAISVTYTVGGTATPNDDYTPLSGSVSFAPFQTGVHVTVPVIDDSVPEMSETVVLTLSSGTGYTINGAGTATVTITDNETPEVTVAHVADTVEGGSPGSFRFSRTGSTSQALTVSYSVDGAAIAGSDYTAQRRTKKRNGLWPSTSHSPRYTVVHLHDRR